MSLNNTPAANRLHIVLFGKRNSGKSSLINALTGQDTALVSDIPGTTTDAVSKGRLPVFQSAQSGNFGHLYERAAPF